MLQGYKVTVMLPKLWKKSFTNATIIPVKRRSCGECRGKILCMTCNNQVNENKELKDKLNLFKRQALNQFRHTLPYYKLQVIKRKVIR